MAGESQREPISAPDPTVITTEIINKEIRHLKEKLEIALDLGLKNIEVRLLGYGDVQEERMRRLEALIDERDRKYNERFNAQQLAVTSAFVASEKAVEAAFKSSQEAITKSEVSMEKRADASYVSLNDLQRQLTALMPRAEAENRIAATTEKINRMEAIAQATVSREEYTARHTALQEVVGSLSSRMDKQEGYSGGAQVDRTLESIKSQLEANTMSLTGGQGQRIGSTEQRNLMFAFAGFIITILGILTAVAALWPDTPGG